MQRALWPRRHSGEAGSQWRFAPEVEPGHAADNTANPNNNCFGEGLASPGEEGAVWILVLVRLLRAYRKRRRVSNAFQGPDQRAASTIVTFFMVSPRLIFMTTSMPSTTWPNTVYLPSSPGCAARQI